MKPRPTSNTWTGQVASAGLAQGAIWPDDRGAQQARCARSHEAEAAALRAALPAAVAELAALSDQADELAAEILEFQIAMLQDDELAAPAFADIAEGAAADTAWLDAIGAQIATYRSDDSEYFRARAADLEDLRDRVLAHLRGGAVKLDARVAGRVIVSDDMAPSRFLALASHDIAALVLRAGSASSHVAILARARGIPMLVGVGHLDDALLAGDACALVDAEQGRLTVDPGLDERKGFDDRVARRTARQRDQARLLPLPAVTRKGTEVAVMVNVDDPALLAAIDIDHCDGSGLVRTELQLDEPGAVTDEALQTGTYGRVIEWARGKPVVFRTLDAGGDKPIPGLTHDGEANPFLGVRGLRLSLERPEVFEIQIRAMLRAARGGELRIMFPMVTAPEEFDRARQIVIETHAAMAAGDRPDKLPPLGMMIEVPAAALRIAEFDADFFSIGSNDLIQYTTACSRDEASLMALQDPHNPAVLELIARVVDHGRQSGKGVSLCGDMASNPDCLADLVGLGLRTLSIAPAALGQIKAALHELDI